MNFRKLRLGAIALVVGLVVSGLAASGAQAATSFFQGFETDTAGWNNDGGTITRVASGDGGVTAASGGWFARLGLDPAPTTCPSGGGPQPVYSAPYTDWGLGGVSSTFPANGFSTGVDVYLDVPYATTHLDTRFDWESSINDTSGSYKRGFDFNVGTDASGFVVTAGNNSTRCGADPYSTDPSHAPKVSITDSGWYTFKHTFSNVAGVLSVKMDLIQKSSGTIVGTWTRSDPSDTIGTSGTVGGPAYGWFVQNEFDGLAIDNSILSIAPVCLPTGFRGLTAAQIGGTVTGTLDATGCNIGAYNPTSVSGANIYGANYFGVVNNGVTTNVTNSAIHDIGETPLNGAQRGNAIYFANDSGLASTGVIKNNMITHYQKGGIVLNGIGSSATISGNAVKGEGPISYIAQNGIEVLRGAKATVTGNTVSDNSYTGAGGVSAAGILVFGDTGEFTTGVMISNNVVTGNDVGVWLFNVTGTGGAPKTATSNTVKFNTISNGFVNNLTGWSTSPACGYQAGVSDLGTKDGIVNNKISGLGYTKQAGGDCTGTPPAFLRFLDVTTKAHGTPSNK